MSLDHLRGVDLNLLKTFQAIYEEQNITKAAEQLNLTQSAVSHALNRMRAHFKDDLFVRTPDGMLPTSIAENIAVKVKQLLVQADILFTQDTAFTPSTSTRKFVIGVPEYVSFYVLQALLTRIQKEAPKTKVIVTTINYMNGHSEVSNEHVDLAIGHFPPTPKFISSEELYHEDFVVAARQDHPVFKDGKVSLEDYLAYQHIHFSLVGKDAGQIDQFLRKTGHSRTVQTTVSNYTLGLSLLSNTDLLYSGPRHITEGMADTFHLKISELPFKSPDITVTQLWHKRYDTDKAHMWLRHLVHDICNEKKKRPSPKKKAS